MLGYWAIFGASLAGYAGLSPLAIVAAAIVLASISSAEHGRTYQRARELGLFGIIDSATLRSALNAILASVAAYGFGYVLRLV